MGCMSVEEKWNSKYTYCSTETFFVPMTENQSGRLYSSRLSVLIVKYWLDRNYVYTVACLSTKNDDIKQQCVYLYYNVCWDHLF